MAIGLWNKYWITWETLELMSDYMFLFPALSALPLWECKAPDS